MNKKEAVNKLIAFAKKEVGYKESATNVTKYAKFFDDLRKQGVLVYNYPKQGASWCDIFVDYCFVQCFGVDEGLKMIYQPKESCGAGCKYSAEYYKKKKAFYISPEVGDQIFFGNPGSEKHTGIVVRVSGASVYTVEGNKDNQVKSCTYRMDNRNIAGYGRPNWDIVVNEKEEPAPAPRPAEPPVSTKPAAPAEPEKPIKYIVTAKSGLNLRKGAGTGFAKIACMPKGASFLVYEIKGNWAYGSYGKLKGWSCMDWLKKV